jgi:hypothetical protein
MPALPRSTFEVPLDGGLITRGDKRAKDVGVAERLLNAEYDDIGGLRVRFPFGVTNTNITGGGTLTNCRKLARRNGELLVFTATALYAWSEISQSWTYRGDHLAVMPDEQTVFAQSGDQSYADRVEYNGLVYYIWDNTSTGVLSTTPSMAVVDPADGSVLATTVLPTRSVSRPRLVAIDSGVLMFGVSTFFNNFCAYTVTYASGAITFGGAAGSGLPVQLGAPSSGGYFYDAVSVPGQNRALVVLGHTSSTAGKFWSIDHTGAITCTTTFGNILGVESMPVTITVSPDVAVVSVAFVQGDISGNFAVGLCSCALSSNTAIAPSFGVGGTALGLFSSSAVLSQLTIVTAAVSGGTATTTAFWSVGEVINAVFASNTNTAVLTVGTGAIVAGTAALFVYTLGIASKAFFYGGRVYVWGVFAGLSFDAGDTTGTHSQLQNTYYLYRDDAFLVSQSAWGEAGGFQPSGYLPTINTITSTQFVFMGQIRRIVQVASNANNPITGTAAYAERAPREVSFTFDDNRARRSLQLGNTLYITGGLVLQYDGAQLAEVGTLTYPWLLQLSVAGAGAIPAAGYTYKASYRWNNAAGELDRSTTATVGDITLTGSDSVLVQLPSNYITRKTNVAAEVWRTEAAPPDGAPYFLATSQDPSVTTGDNAFVLSTPSSASLLSMTDNLTDAVLSIGPANPENNGVLAAIEPPPASIIMTDAQRIYLAGIPGYPNTVYYSKYRQAGLVVAFNDYLSFDVPPVGGAIVALDYLDGGLIVWCESATYQYVGPGYGDDGSGGNFQLQRTLSTEIGATAPEAIELCEEGWYIKTLRGWYLLDRGLNYTDVDAGPYRYGDEPVIAVVAMKTRHQLRVVTANRVLMLDTLVKKWSEWTISDAVDMIVDTAGVCTYLTATGSRQEITTWDGYAGTDASLTEMQLETTWIKPDGRQQGRYIIDFLQLLGEFRSACVIRAQLAKDYEQTSPGNPNWLTDKTWSPFPTINGTGLERRTAPTRKRCATIKARYTITNPDGVSPLGGPCVRLNSITGSYAVEPGVYSAIASAQKD